MTFYKNLSTSLKMKKTLIVCLIAFVLVGAYMTSKFFSTPEKVMTIEELIAHTEKVVADTNKLIAESKLLLGEKL